jgi:hypothetical protein
MLLDVYLSFEKAVQKWNVHPRMVLSTHESPTSSITARLFSGRRTAFCVLRQDDNLDLKLVSSPHVPLREDVAYRLRHLTEVRDRKHDRVVADARRSITLRAN